jgi:hypothetical protein
MYDYRIEISSRYWFDMVRLKFIPTATRGTPPSIPLKRQNAVGEIEFIIVLWCD